MQGHAVSYPFKLDFDLFDKAKWLDEIITKEGIDYPILIGQSMGGYLGQVYAELFPKKIKGLISCWKVYFHSLPCGLISLPNRSKAIKCATS